MDQAAVRARAQRILSQFTRAGCAPHHVVVDYGCISLWVGEAFMAHLDPGNYIGLDVSETFYAEGLARLEAELGASRRPTFRVISDAALEDVRGRKPAFILSLAVVHHIPPQDLPLYFARIVSLAADSTRIEITHQVGLRTRWLPPRRCSTAGLPSDRPWRRSAMPPNTGRNAAFWARCRALPWCCADRSSSRPVDRDAAIDQHGRAGGEARRVGRQVQH